MTTFEHFNKNQSLSQEELFIDASLMDTTSTPLHKKNNRSNAAQLLLQRAREWGRISGGEGSIDTLSTTASSAVNDWMTEETIGHNKDSMTNGTPDPTVPPSWGLDDDDRDLENERRGGRFQDFHTFPTPDSLFRVEQEDECSNAKACLTTTTEFDLPPLNGKLLIPFPRDWCSRPRFYSLDVSLPDEEDVGESEMNEQENNKRRLPQLPTLKENMCLFPGDDESHDLANPMLQPLTGAMVSLKLPGIINIRTPDRKWGEKEIISFAKSGSWDAAQGGSKERCFGSNNHCARRRKLNRCSNDGSLKGFMGSGDEGSDTYQDREESVIMNYNNNDCNIADGSLTETTTAEEEDLDCCMVDSEGLTDEEEEEGGDGSCFLNKNARKVRFSPVEASSIHEYVSYDWNSDTEEDENGSWKRRLDEILPWAYSLTPDHTDIILRSGDSGEKRAESIKQNPFKLGVEMMHHDGVLIQDPA